MNMSAVLRLHELYKHFAKKVCPVNKSYIYADKAFWRGH